VRARAAHRPPASLLARLTPAYRQSWLERLRREDAHRARREIIAFKAQLDGITADAGAS